MLLAGCAPAAMLKNVKSNGSFQGLRMRVCVAVNDGGRPIGEDHAQAKYLDADVQRARAFRAEGYTWHEISRMLDMPIRTIRDYVNGTRRNQSVAGFKWVTRGARKRTRSEVQ